MCMDKDYQMIDHSIKINKEELPKLLQYIIKDLEKYDKEGNIEMYDGFSSGFYAVAKNFYAEGVISESIFKQLIRKYGGDY